MKTPVANFILAVTVAVFLSSLSSALPASAAKFDPGYIISDGIMTNKDAMTLATISTFINTKNAACTDYLAPCLKNFTENGKSAAQIIYETAQAYNINPQVLLVTLQKETYLVSDTRPEPWQYRTAMGYGCPDTAACDSKYFGFTNQTRWAATLFHSVVTQSPTWYSPYVPGPNYIAYNPVSSCGGSTVNIANWATAALYDYTPYQPDAAALAAGYGSAEPCGAYGNRNFWLYFNDWFGSPTHKDFSILKSPTSQQQYLSYNNLKQYLPSPYIKEAWGLQYIPVETVDQSYINGLVNGPDLDIVYRTNNGTALYMVDNGQRYYIPTPGYLAAWGLNNRAISNVPTGLGLTPADSGQLSMTISQIGAGNVYMIDGINTSNQPVIRRYANPDVLSGIEGHYQITAISPTLFATLSQSVGGDLTSTKATYLGSEYQMISGTKRYMNNYVAQLYPGNVSAISRTTFERLAAADPMTPFFIAPDSPHVYLAQNGQKYRIANPSVLSAWTGSQNRVIPTNFGFINLLPESPSPISTTISKAAASYIIENGAKLTIPSNLVSAYTSNSGAFQASQALMDALPTGSRQLSRVVLNKAEGQIMALDDSSTLHPIPSVPVAESWGANSTNVTTLIPETIAGFQRGALASSIVSDGISTFALVNGTLHSTSSSASDWKLPAPMLLSDGTLANFPQSAPLQSFSKSGNNYYKFIDGTVYVTTDPKIAHLWGLPSNAPDYSRLIATYYPQPAMLTPVIKTGNTYFMADQNKLISMSIPMYANLKINYPVMGIDTGVTGLPIHNWQLPIFTNTSGGSYIMDGGVLRTFSHSIILSHWTNSITSSTLVATDAFISLFPVKSPIERAIKSVSSPNIYSAEGAHKRWITNWDTYITQYAPVTNVSRSLLDAMPDGPNI